MHRVNWEHLGEFARLWTSQTGKQRMESLAISMQQGGSTQSPVLAPGEPRSRARAARAPDTAAQQPTDALSSGGEAVRPGCQSQFASHQL